MPDFTIRGYRSEDEGPLLDLWNAALDRDPIDAPTFRRKVLLDPNFHPDWLAVAEGGGGLIGFCLCLVRRVPLEQAPLDPERGWISAMGVHPDFRRRGVGSALIERVCALLRGAGRRQVYLASYIPNYFVPGVDVQAYAGGLEALQRRGFVELDRPISMDANIVLLDTAPFIARQHLLRDQGIEVRTMRPDEIPRLMALLQAHMPPDWVRHAREVLTDISKGLAGWDQFTIAVKGDEAVGYCQFEHEHFGPFGVRQGLQGMGIGTVLLAKCLRSMQRRGLHHAWVLWTSDENARKIYGKFGFRPTRRFAVLRKDL
ncbi:MAG: GNAT family N-acetyltransferase [Gemmatimonadota bacterium]